jgi:hypothetical protein
MTQRVLAWTFIKLLSGYDLSGGLWWVLCASGTQSVRRPWVLGDHESWRPWVRADNLKNL